MDCAFLLKPVISSCENRSCVDCYTGKFTLSNIILHKRAIGWTLVASQAEMRKDECMSLVVAYQRNLIVINYWREIL